MSSPEWEYSLPQFLIVGAQRSGTTSLYNWLVSHPGVFAAAHKEVHFFDINYRRGLAFYCRHFKSTKSDAWTYGRITGEASPYYLFHPLVPERVSCDLPDCKVIILLRNPIDRAYSHYRYEFARGFETLSFFDAVLAEASRLRGEEERLISDPKYVSFAHVHYSYISRGLYDVQLKRWLQFIPAPRLLVISSDDLFHRTESALAMVCAFLGLEGNFSEPFRCENAQVPAKLSLGARDYLKDLFKPHNESLSELLKSSVRNGPNLCLWQ